MGKYKDKVELRKTGHDVLAFDLAEMDWIEVDLHDMVSCDVNPNLGNFEYTDKGANKHISECETVNDLQIRQLRAEKIEVVILPKNEDHL